MKYILGIIGFAVVGLLLTTVIVDVHYFSAVMDAETPDAIKAACTNSWYAMDSLKELPVRCLTYYNK